MKKLTILSVAACATIMLSSCKSSESAYKKNYEKAQATENSEFYNGEDKKAAPVEEVAPISVQRDEVAPVANDETVRKENLSLVDGAGLKAFSVVVGSFGVKANAEGLQQRLKSEGYNAQIAFNPSNKMYRVVASTFDSKSSAISSKKQLLTHFSDAWLLAK